jgi:hypothetical protein
MSDAMILEYAFSNVLKTVCETSCKEMRIQTASPLKERLFVPLLKRLIAHYGPRHLLVLLVDGLLRKGQHFRRIVAFKSYTLAIQLSDLTESLARKRSWCLREV